MDIILKHCRENRILWRISVPYFLSEGRFCMPLQCVDSWLKSDVTQLSLHKQQRPTTHTRYIAARKYDSKQKHSDWSSLRRSQETWPSYARQFKVIPPEPAELAVTVVDLMTGYVTTFVMLRPLGGGIKRWCCLTPGVSLSRTSGLSQEQRGYRKIKLGTEITHVTHDSDTTFKVNRSKVKVTRPLWLAVLAANMDIELVTDPLRVWCIRVTTWRRGRGILWRPPAYSLLDLRQLVWA